MTGGVCIAGVLVLLAGTLLAAFTRSSRAGLLVQAAGSTLMGISGGAVLWQGHAVGAGFRSGIHPALGVDRLSGVFLLMLGIVSGPVLVYAAGYLHATGRDRAVAV